LSFRMVQRSGSCRYSFPASVLASLIIWVVSTYAVFFFPNSIASSSSPNSMPVSRSALSASSIDGFIWFIASLWSKKTVSIIDLLLQVGQYLEGLLEFEVVHEPNDGLLALAQVVDNGVGVLKLGKVLQLLVDVGFVSGLASYHCCASA